MQVQVKVTLKESDPDPNHPKVTLAAEFLKQLMQVRNGNFVVEMIILFMGPGFSVYRLILRIRA